MRRFELSDGKSNKFWQVETQGVAMTVSFGRIGTQGQTQTKSFGSSAAADTERQKLIAEKTKKGYVEVAATPSTTASPVVVPPAVPSPGATATIAQASPASAATVAPPTLEAISAPGELESPNRSSDTSEATADELPRVLASPPWLSPTPPTPLPQIEKFAPVVDVPTITFTFEERQRFAQPSPDIASLRTYNILPFALEPGTPSMDAHVLARIAKGHPIRYGVAHLGLMSPDAARQALASIDLHALLPEHYDLRHLLARYGDLAIERFFDLARMDADLAARALVPVESARVGALMGQLFVRGSRYIRPLVLDYFKSHPEASALGILPLALAKKSQKGLVKALLALASVSGRGPIDAAAARLGAEVAKAVDPLLAYTGPPKPLPVLPAWFDPEKLPPLWLASAERRLGAQAVRHFATLLAMTELDEPDPLLDEVKAVVTRDSLARFSWGLLLSWLEAGADAKEDWAMLAMGAIGDDACAKNLVPMIRSWPGESAHARAVKGLDVLAGIGSDVALMHLDAIAEKVKFKGLQERAREKIAQVAEKRGLTRDELADRVAPTLDLDADGSRVLSFGSRSFRVGFDEHLQPFVADEADKRLGDLPKPRATDDATLAKDAVETWKTLKKDARAVATNQIARLERAMCSRRRWSGRELQTLLVGHPLIFHLTKRLLWAVYRDDRFAVGFRVAEDRSLADVDDSLFELADDATVGLVHRFDIDDDVARRWGSLLSDYAILQPFPQLARDVYRASEAELEGTAIHRFANLEVPTGKVLGLESRGWRRGAPQDGGWIWEMVKPLPGGHAELALGAGLSVSHMAETPATQTLGAITLHRGGGGGAKMLVGDLSPLVFSELVRDMEGFSQ